MKESENVSRFYHIFYAKKFLKLYFLIFAEK